MVNTALCKTFQNAQRNNYLAITDVEKYFICPIGIDIMKYLLFKDHYCSISEGLYHLQNHKDWTLVLYFKNDVNIKSFCFISVQDITRNFILQWIPNHYLLAMVEQSPYNADVPETQKTRFSLLTSSDKPP